MLAIRTGRNCVAFLIKIYRYMKLLRATQFHMLGLEIVSHLYTKLGLILNCFFLTSHIKFYIYIIYYKILYIYIL